MPATLPPSRDLDPSNGTVRVGVPSLPMEEFDDVPLSRPSVPDSDILSARLVEILESGVLTNGPFVREFERSAADYIGVRHCIAVASCTAGLMLVLRASELSGDVVVPSFTFMATAHAVSWNGLRPVFADIDASTLTLSPGAVERAIGVRTSAILATHVYGTPCDIDGLSAIARRHGIRLFFDAAHAFGSHHSGKAIGGFGDAEVFSLSPTKVLVAGEGGVIATNDDLLAERCRIGRDYGNPGNYDCQFIGLNARMSEIHAAQALASLQTLDARVERRNTLVRRYQDRLSDVPGVDFPTVPPTDRSTFKDFTILIEPGYFGGDADTLAGALDSVGIRTRRYYSPPVHLMQAYRRAYGTNGGLAITEAVSRRVLTLPLWSEMPIEVVDRVADAVERIHDHLVTSGVGRASARGPGQSAASAPHSVG